MMECTGYLLISKELDCCGRKGLEILLLEEGVKIDQELGNAGSTLSSTQPVPGAASIRSMTT